MLAAYAKTDIALLYTQTLIAQGAMTETDHSLMALRLSKPLEGANSETYTRIGMDLYRLNASQLSKTAYQQAIKADESNTTAIVNLGWLLYREGHYEEAITLYRDALGKDDTSIAWFNLALAYLAAGSDCGFNF